MTKLLNRLTKFYKNEADNIPHSKPELFEVAWDLADILEDWGPDSNIWKSGDEEMEETVANLKTKHTVAEYITLIDTVINEMHQGLLSSQLEDEYALMDFCAGNIVEYLLRRNDTEFWTERDEWMAAEDAKEVRLDELEAAW